MKIYHHFLISILAGSIFLFLADKQINSFNLTPWIIGGVLVDLDHLLIAFSPNLSIIGKKRKIKKITLKVFIKKIFEEYQQDNQYFYLFHTIEFALFLGLMVRYKFVVWPVWLAYLIHLSLDGIRHQKMKRNFSWVKKWSILLILLKTPKLQPVEDGNLRK